MEQLERLVLIGGAPRTGTSMLVRALDWHPELLAFPREPEFLSTIFFNEKAEPVMTGKEFDFSDRARLDAMSQIFLRLEEPEIFEFYKRFDTKAFAANYRTAYEQSRSVSCLQAYIRGLYEGLLSSSPSIHERHKGRHPHFVLKMPFFTEATFERYLALSFDVHLIHIDRDPVERYASAKARSRSGGSLQAVGKLNYATFQTFLHATSNILVDGLAHKYPARILKISYDELRTSTAAERICDFLNIAWDDTLLRQTLHGMNQRLPSAFGFINRGGTADDELRHAALKSLMDNSEAIYVRDLHSAALTGSLRRLGHAIANKDSLVRATLDLLKSGSGRLL
jgi:sulfotransferase family protein